MSDFAVDNAYGRKALESMLKNFLAVMGGKRCPFPDIEPEFITDGYTHTDFVDEAAPELEAVGVIGGKSKTPSVPTFLNRLFGVQLEIQKKIFRYFLDALDQTILVAKQNNEYAEGIVLGGPCE